MTEDEWLATYKPKKNHLDSHASWNGTLFETYGDEEEFVNSVPENLIWTLMQGDEGQTLISNGFSFVNRLGYFVCDVPWNGDEFHEIVIDDDPEGHVAYGTSSYDLGYHHAMNNFIQVLEVHESDEAIAF